MTSSYLSEEACRQREGALVKRIANEAIDLGPAGITWPPESDFWRLPKATQELITRSIGNRK
jgi:hypothetical protein